MIEINLVPDVKQELLRAQRVRTTVISFAALTAAGAIGLVVLLSIYIFGVQTARHLISDNGIKEENSKLTKVPDLANTLTIQNQLTKLSQMHKDKTIDSRLFDILVAINPPAPNDVTISNLKLDPSTSILTIEGQATNGYAALEVFKKTILSSRILYTDGSNESQEVILSEMVSLGETSYGEDADGRKVLRFALSFSYPEEVFSSTIRNASIIGPNGQKNVTDSFVRIPESIFSDRASDVEGE